MTGKQKGTLFFQLTQEPLISDHSHLHEKAEEPCSVQNPSNAKGLGETEITNLPEKEFKIKVIIMLMEVQRNMQELRDNSRGR